MIDEGIRAEEKYLKDFGSLVMNEAVEFDHPIGTVIKGYHFNAIPEQVKRSEMTAQGPMTPLKSAPAVFVGKTIEKLNGSSVASVGASPKPSKPPTAAAAAMSLRDSSLSPSSKGASLEKEFENEKGKREKKEGIEPEQHQQPFKAGDKVEARFKGIEQFYSGLIEKINPDGTYDISFDDGDKDGRVPLNHIRALRDENGALGEGAGITSGNRKTAAEVVVTEVRDSVIKEGVVEALEGNQWLKRTLKVFPARLEVVDEVPDRLMQVKHLK